MKWKINRGMRRMLEALEESSELRYTSLKEKSKLSDPVLTDYLNRLRSFGLVEKAHPTLSHGGYRITAKGRLEMTRIHENDLVANTDTLLRSVIEAKFPDSLPQPLSYLPNVLPNGVWSGDRSPLFEYMPPPASMGVTLYGSKQLRQSLGLPEGGVSEVPESEASHLLSGPWSDVGKSVRQLVYWLLIGYFMDLAESNQAPNLWLQLGLNIRLDVQDNPEVRHRVAGILFWHMSLTSDDPSFGQFPILKLLKLMKKASMMTGDEAKLLRNLNRKKDSGKFESKCLEFSLKYFAEGGCFNAQKGSSGYSSKI
jgi:predicted transcriptional regulator